MPLIKKENKRLITDPAEIGTLDHGGKLDTGMKAEEAVMRATNWWERRGRALMQQNNMRQIEPVGGSNNGIGASFAVRDPENANFNPSGILAGLPWDELDREEKLRVVKVWHHYAVRSPDEIEVGADTDETEPQIIAVERVKEDD